MKVGNLAVSGEKGVTQQESKAALLENQRRERVIIRTSWVGIVTNVLLALCKAGVGGYVQFHCCSYGCSE